MDLELSPTHLDKEENIWFDNSKGTRTIVAATLSELFQLFITSILFFIFFLFKLLNYRRRA